MPAYRAAVDDNLFDLVERCQDTGTFGTNREKSTIRYLAHSIAWRSELPAAQDRLGRLAPRQAAIHAECYA